MNRTANSCETILGAFFAFVFTWFLIVGGLCVIGVSPPLLEFGKVVGALIGVYVALVYLIEKGEVKKNDVQNI